MSPLISPQISLADKPLNFLPPFYFFEDHSRCLISPRIGCRANCKYCYLNDLNLTNLQNLYTIDPKTLIYNIHADNRFSVGESGTIISFGCYTECLFNQSFEDTVILINHFLSLKNKISISTKLSPIRLLQRTYRNIQYRNQFSIFISCPTITEYKKYEKSTLNPTVRIKKIDEIRSYGANPFLYIKPFLGDDTNKDFELFRKYAQHYKTNAVVGKMFSSSGEQPAPISPDVLRICDNSQYQLFKSNLSNYCNVFERSIELLLI